MVQLCPSGHQFSGCNQVSTKRKHRTMCLHSLFRQVFFDCKLEIASVTLLQHCSERFAV